jgi:hypothetical protein
LDRDYTVVKRQTGMKKERVEEIDVTMKEKRRNKNKKEKRKRKKVREDRGVG